MDKIIKAVIVIIGILFFGFQNKAVVEKSTTTDSYGNITVEELQLRLSSGENLILLDVRTAREFNGLLGHIDGAILIPVQELEKRVGVLGNQKGEEIIVICRSGNRSKTGSEILTRYGHYATNLLGGMNAWNKLDKEKSE